MKLLNLFLITLLGITLPAQLLAAAATRHVSAEETVYLFDYHDVMAKQDNRIVGRYALQHKHPLYLIRLVGSLTLFGINKFFKSNKPMLNIEYATLHNITDKNYQEYVLNIINPFIIAPDMLEYVRDIKAHGSMAFLFSNIGQQSFDFMRGTQYLDPLFDGKYICNENNNFTNKKSPEAFKMLLHDQIIPRYQEIHGANTYPKRIIMIDDSLEKMVVAQDSLIIEQNLHPEFAEIQFIPIVFKNVAQTRTEIAALTEVQ